MPDFEFDFLPVPGARIDESVILSREVHALWIGVWDRRRIRETPEADAAYEADRRMLADRREAA
jgi:hypothetical protein